MKTQHLLAAFCLAPLLMTTAQTLPGIAQITASPVNQPYPASPKRPVVDSYFGKAVTDNHRQPENMNSPDSGYQSTSSGYTTPQDSPSGRKLLKSARLPVSMHKGDVVLNTGVRLRGHLSYQPLTNTLRVREVDTWRTYPANQIRHFSYIDQTDNQAHHITAFPVPSALGETRTLLLEELIPDAPIPLLQLPLPTSQYGTTLQDLPHPRTANWQTEQPCYIWFDGRLLAPDVFVRTEIDALLTIVPESVQHWAAAYPRPTCLPTLAQWLSAFGRELTRVQPNPAGVQSRPATSPASTRSTLY